MYVRSRSQSGSDFRVTYWPCRAGGIWEHADPCSLAHMLPFRGKLELAPRSLTTGLQWCSQSKLQCRHSCLWLSLNFCLTDHKHLLVGSAQWYPQRELTMYSSASSSLLMFLLIPKAPAGRQEEPEVLHADDLLGKQNTEAVEVMAEASVKPHQCSGRDLTEGLRGVETFEWEVPSCSSSKEKGCWERWFTRWRFINRWETPVQQCQQTDTDLPGKLLPPSKHLAWASPTQTTEGIIALLILVTTSSKRVNKAHYKHKHIPAN